MKNPHFEIGTETDLPGGRQTGPGSRADVFRITRVKGNEKGGKSRYYEKEENRKVGP